MNLEHLTLTKEKIAAHCKVSKDLFNEAKIKFGLDGLDYVTKTLTAQIETFVLQRINETQKVVRYAERPTLLGMVDKKAKTI